MLYGALYLTRLTNIDAQTQLKIHPIIYHYVSLECLQAKGGKSYESFCVTTHSIDVLYVYNHCQSNDFAVGMYISISPSTHLEVLFSPSRHCQRKVPTLVSTQRPGASINSSMGLRDLSLCNRCLLLQICLLNYSQGSSTFKRRLISFII